MGTGNLPKFGENLYRDSEEDFWFVPTAEVPVTNLYRDEILEPGQLPIYHVAYTPCFRREKMSAGRDVRGIKRGHQFDKVEMVRMCRPSESDAALEELREALDHLFLSAVEASEEVVAGSAAGTVTCFWSEPPS